MIKLGEHYEDKVTGFKGIAISKTEYLNGCVTILIQPENLDKDGKPAESEYFDIQRLISDSEVDVGGPGPIPPTRPAS